MFLRSEFYTGEILSQGRVYVCTREGGIWTPKNWDPRYIRRQLRRYPHGVGGPLNEPAFLSISICWPEYYLSNGRCYSLAGSMLVHAVAFSKHEVWDAVNGWRYGNKKGYRVNEPTLGDLVTGDPMLWI